MRAEFFAHSSDAKRLGTVVAEVDAGLQVLVDRIVPLDRAAEVLDVVAAGHARGKVLVEPRPDGTSRGAVPRLTDRREP